MRISGIEPSLVILSPTKCSKNCNILQSVRTRQIIKIVKIKVYNIFVQSRCKKNQNRSSIIFLSKPDAMKNVNVWIDYTCSHLAEKLRCKCKSYLNCVIIYIAYKFDMAKLTFYYVIVPV